MTLSKTCANFFKQFAPVKCYDSIHNMPISVWLKVHDTGDLNVLTIKGYPDQKILSKAWNKCYDEYIKEFGLNDGFKRYLDKKKMLIYAQCDYGLDAPDSPTFSIHETLLRIAQMEVDTFFDSEEKGNFNTLYSRIEKYQARRLSRTETTVFEFYNHVRAMNEDIAEQIRLRNEQK